jgi:hypothetical protein
MNETQLPIPRTTLTEMVVAYNQAEQDIRTAYAMLAQAQERLSTAFQAERSYAFDLRDDSGRCSVDYTNPDALMLKLKHSAWKALVDKMGVRSAMSIKRAKELDEQLEGKRDYHGGPPIEPLPDITETNILAMMEQTFNQLPAMIEEAVREVFDWLRPSSSWRLEYKTNQKSKWQLKDKLIIYCISQGYGQQPYQVNYTYRQNVTALDNVFLMLDGKGIVKTTYGPLTDAIHASPDGTGETDYFSFRCFGNGNLHLKFKRADLVEKLNAVAGGMRLKDMERKAA